jgi:hypothetical protein
VTKGVAATVAMPRIRPKIGQEFDRLIKIAAK